jgi:hypothetical protein
MSAPEIENRQLKRKNLVISFITGFAGVLALILVFLVNQWVWEPFVFYNFYLIIIQITQLLFTELLVLFFTGAWTVSQCRLSVNDRNDALITGLLPGSVIGTGIAFCIVLTRSLPEGSWIIPVFSLMIISIFFSSLGTTAGAVGYYQGLSHEEKGGVGKNKGTQFKFTLTALFILILLSVTVPPALAYIGTTSGIISNDCPECRIHQDVRAERLDTRTISIMYSAKVPALSWIGSYNPPGIIINGVDTSNQTAANGNGFSAIVSPAYGRTYSENSSVTISGDGVSLSRGSPVHLTVISSNGSEQPVILYDDYV